VPTVNVDKATHELFTAFVFGRHGKLRGVLQNEASAALRNHIKLLGAKK
jgi:hypothetical protein